MSKGKDKGKDMVLDIRRLTMRSSALQPWTWQLTGIGYSTAAPIAHATDFGPAVMQPDVLRPVSLHPVIHVHNCMDHYSFTDP